jgi:hypothetical protein
MDEIDHLLPSEREEICRIIDEMIRDHERIILRLKNHRDQVMVKIPESKCRKYKNIIFDPGKGRVVELD